MLRGPLILLASASLALSACVQTRQIADVEFEPPQGDYSLIVMRPDVSVVTMVSAAHLEMFGDLDGVARAKRELVEALDVDGVAVLNADDDRVAAMATAAPGRVVLYGRARGDWRATNVELDAWSVVIPPDVVVDSYEADLGTGTVIAGTA